MFQWMFLFGEIEWTDETQISSKIFIQQDQVDVLQTWQVMGLPLVSAQLNLLSFLVLLIVGPMLGWRSRKECSKPVKNKNRFWNAWNSQSCAADEVLINYAKGQNKLIRDKEDGDRQNWPSKMSNIKKYNLMSKYLKFDKHDE